MHTRLQASVRGFATVAAVLLLAGSLHGQDARAREDAAETREASAREILEAYEAVSLPEYDPSRREDPAYQAEFMTQRRAADRQRAKLVGDLLAGFPAHPRLVELLPIRWRILLGEGRNEEVIAEALAVAESTEDPTLRLDALYVHAVAVARASAFDPARIREAARLFYEANPLDPRNARLLLLATINEPEPSASLELYQRLAAEYPETREGQRAADKVFQYERIGTPVELAFNDAISGEPVDLADLRGRVVALVFWASWCPSCREEMAELDALREAYEPLGASFVGVSLDGPRDDDPARDGLARLRAWVADNGIPWPQSYDGQGWDGPFVQRWRVRSIPTLFVIDQEGRLVTPDGRARLGELLPESLGVEPVRSDGEAPDNPEDSAAPAEGATG